MTRWHTERMPDRSARAVIVVRVTAWIISLVVRATRNPPGVLTSRAKVTPSWNRQKSGLSQPQSPTTPLAVTRIRPLASPARRSSAGSHRATDSQYPVSPHRVGQHGGGRCRQVPAVARQDVLLVVPHRRQGLVPVREEPKLERVAAGIQLDPVPVPGGNGDPAYRVVVGAEDPFPGRAEQEHVPVESSATTKLALRP